MVVQSFLIYHWRAKPEFPFHLSQVLPSSKHLTNKPSKPRLMREKGGEKGRTLYERK